VVDHVADRSPRGELRVAGGTDGARMRNPFQAWAEAMAAGPGPA
jgi:hypothetical protein